MKAQSLSLVPALAILSLLLLTGVRANAYESIRSAIGISPHPMMQFDSDALASSKANISGVTGFRRDYTEARHNGLVHYGTYNGYESALIEKFSDTHLLFIVKQRGTARTYESARSHCQSLGTAWDLPTFDRRTQLTTLSATFAPIQGTFVDPINRKNDLLAFWLRFRSEGDNEIAFDDVNEAAFVLSYPTADRDYIGDLEPKISRLALEGKFFIDGLMYMTEQQYNTEQSFLLSFSATKLPYQGSLVRVIRGYLNPEERILMPARLLQPVVEYFAANPKVENAAKRLFSSGGAKTIQLSLLPPKVRAQSAIQVMKSLKPHVSKRLFQTLSIGGVDALRSAVPRGSLSNAEKKEFKEAETKLFHRTLDRYLSYRSPIPAADLNKLWTGSTRWHLDIADSLGGLGEVYFQLQRSHGTAFPLLCAQEPEKFQHIPPVYPGTDR